MYSMALMRWEIKQLIRKMIKKMWHLRLESMIEEEEEVKGEIEGVRGSGEVERGWKIVKEGVDILRHADRNMQYLNVPFHRRIRHALKI